MVQKYGSPGIWHTPAYQASGWPWISGSAILSDTVQRVRFPRVTKSFTVMNTGSEGAANIFVTFAPPIDKQFADGPTGDFLPGAVAAGSADDVYSANHFVAIAPGTGSFTFDLKCREVYISNVAGVLGQGASDTGYKVLAELTSIASGSMWVLTGSGISSTDGT